MFWAALKDVLSSSPAESLLARERRCRTHNVSSKTQLNFSPVMHQHLVQSLNFILPLTHFPSLGKGSLIIIESRFITCNVT